MKVAFVTISFAIVAFSGVHAGLFGSSCTDVPSNLCARVYDDEDCKGWELDVPEGRMNFRFFNPVWYWYRNDIESVSVRKGCSLTGFDDTNWTGQSATIVARSRDRHVNLDDEDEYEDLDEEIESLQCTCTN
eukprot:TRINITY_DN3212_c0_g1_i6.p1 TRINITY_DN3212_c0_g1~~TRINITY_DN3212_c0_g1_i6.p1  ORF type:complete len:143 (-),score=23.02 TRINITY_DN3212_c0_g1_i6:212-607(-)